MIIPLTPTFRMSKCSSLMPLQAVAVPLVIAQYLGRVTIICGVAAVAYPTYIIYAIISMGTCTQIVPINSVPSCKNCFYIFL